MPRPLMLIESNVMDHFGNLVSTTYVDFRDCQGRRERPVEKV